MNIKKQLQSMKYEICELKKCVDFLTHENNELLFAIVSTNYGIKYVARFIKDKKVCQVDLPFGHSGWSVITNDKNSAKLKTFILSGKPYYFILDKEQEVVVPCPAENDEKNANEVTANGEPTTT